MEFLAYLLTHSLTHSFNRSNGIPIIPLFLSILKSSSVPKYQKIVALTSLDTVLVLTHSLPHLLTHSINLSINTRLITFLYIIIMQKLRWRSTTMSCTISWRRFYSPWRNSMTTFTRFIVTTYWGCWSLITRAHSLIPLYGTSSTNYSNLSLSINYWFISTIVVITVTIRLAAATTWIATTSCTTRRRISCSRYSITRSSINYSSNLFSLADHQISALCTRSRSMCDEVAKFLDPNIEEIYW